MAIQQVIGMIGGLSWESTSEYYRLINQAVRERLGGVHSARILMWSFDFGEIEKLQMAGRWDEATGLMIDAAKRLERGGADFIIICTNTMHLMADEIVASISIPLLHIADPTAIAIGAMGLKRAGLLGTAFTMEQRFYRDRLVDRFGLEVMVPEMEDRAMIQRIIYDELVKGHVIDKSRVDINAAIGRLITRGAEAIILGCTELMMLVRQFDCTVPLFDTTTLHAMAAVKRALDLENTSA